jgi:hypothetical protein
LTRSRGWLPTSRSVTTPCLSWPAWRPGPAELLGP